MNSTAGIRGLVGGQKVQCLPKATHLFDAIYDSEGDRNRVKKFLTVSADTYPMS